MGSNPTLSAFGKPCKFKGDLDFTGLFLTFDGCHFKRLGAKNKVLGNFCNKICYKNHRPRAETIVLLALFAARACR